MDGNACHPGDVQTFMPTAYRPASGRWQSFCSNDVIQAIYADCFDPSSSKPSRCSADSMNYPSCAACINTSSSASRYGPLITDNTGWVRPNVAGCVELSDPNDTATLSCAKGVQALSACELAACEINCAVVNGDTYSQMQYGACQLQADTGGCAAFTAAASCDLPGVAVGSAYAKCSSTSFETFYDFAVPLFCGPPAFDAGPAVDASFPSADAGAVGDGASTSSSSYGAGSSNASNSSSALAADASSDAAFSGDARENADAADANGDASAP